MDIDLPKVLTHVARWLRAHPERWIQGAFARHRNGQACTWRSHDACRCLEGHVMYYATRGVHRATHKGRIADRAVTALNSLGHARGLFGSGSAAEWNDVRGRNVLDVILLCEELAAS